MAGFPFVAGIENGNFSKWWNSRLLPALKKEISVRLQVSSLKLFKVFQQKK
jgi:hypothetical protein